MSETHNCPKCGASLPLPSSSPWETPPIYGLPRLDTKTYIPIYIAECPSCHFVEMYGLERSPRTHDANKIAAVKANTKSDESPSRRLNREAYERQAADLKKRYPREYLGFLDGKLVAHDGDGGEMIRKFSRLGVEGNTLSIFYTGSNDASTTGSLGELCPNCNAPLAPPPAIFCSNCGYQSRCNKCMSIRPVDAEFCGDCGYPTRSDTKRSDEEKAKARTKRYYAMSRKTLTDNVR